MMVDLSMCLYVQGLQLRVLDFVVQLSMLVVFLTSDIGGTLYIASCIDANNQIFPIIFGIGDSENNLAWQLFFERLKVAIGVFEEIIFVTNRHKIIENVISTVFLSASHGICVYYL